jgi:hypothetical protein
MKLHSLPHHGNASMIRMWAGVALIPAAFLIILFVIAHFV